MRATDAQADRDLTADDPGLDGVLVADPDLALHLRCPLGELGDEPGQQVGAERSRPRDDETARLEALEAGDGVLERAQQVEDPAGVVDDDLPCWRAAGTLRGAVDELHAQRVLEVPDVVRHRRLVM